MAIVRCGRGHFYDDEKYTDCPMCASKNSPLNAEPGGDERTMALFTPSFNNDDERTIGINLKTKNCDPVVGWLVCMEGENMGRDYRIHSGRNFIGRDFSNDIAISYDPTINRKDAGYIIYEPRKNMFMAVNGESACITVDGELASKPCIITEESEIYIGKYKFALAAFCKGDKRW